MKKMEKMGERAHVLILGHAADVAGKNSSSTPALSFSVTPTFLHTSNHGSHLLSSQRLSSAYAACPFSPRSAE